MKVGDKVLYGHEVVEIKAIQDSRPQFDFPNGDYDLYVVGDSEEIAFPNELSDLTCNHCTDPDSCPYAWDGYNTNGDCLASK